MPRVARRDPMKPLDTHEPSKKTWKNLLDWNVGTPTIGTSPSAVLS